MYIHAGSGAVVRVRDIIGIFDIENTSVSKDSREYLALAGKRKTAVDISNKMPKSFVAAVDTDTGRERVYISPVSSSTIIKRVKAGEKK